MSSSAFSSERLAPINQAMAKYPFGSRAGVLSIAIDDRSNVAIGDFKRELAAWSAYALPDGGFENAARDHARLVRFMEKIRGDLDTGVFLDVRKLVDIKVVATWPDDPDRGDRLFTKLGERAAGKRRSWWRSS